MLGASKERCTQAGDLALVILMVATVKGLLTGRESVRQRRRVDWSLRAATRPYSCSLLKPSTHYVK